MLVSRSPESAEGEVEVALFCAILSEAKDLVMPRPFTEFTLSEAEGFRATVLRSSRAAILPAV